MNIKKLLCLFVISLITITSYAEINNENNIKHTELSYDSKKTVRDKLIETGWEELATVYAVTKSTNKYNDGNGDYVMRGGTYFIIFYKDKHYIAIREDYINHSSATRYSVTKGNFRILGNSYTGKISWQQGILYYFNF